MLRMFTKGDGNGVEQSFVIFCLLLAAEKLRVGTKSPIAMTVMAVCQVLTVCRFTFLKKPVKAGIG